MHRDVLVGLASLPEIPCVEKLLLPSSDDQVTQVLVYHDGVALLHAFPLVEVLGNLSVDHVLDGVDASLATRANGFLSLALNRLVQAFDGGCTVTFESLSHQDELLFFLTDTKSIKALLKKCPITVLFESKHCHASSHHVLLILNRLLPCLHKRPQSIQSLPTHVKQHKSHLIVDDALELSLGKGLRQDVKPDLVAKSLTVSVPL